MTMLPLPVPPSSNEISADGFPPSPAENLRLYFFVKDVFKKWSARVVAVSDLGFRDRRRLGNLLFFAFCITCLMLGVVKSFVGVLMGFSDKGEYLRLGIWAKPNSENFTQYIGYTVHQKKLDSMTNGYILINANGGLNQMRFGVIDANYLF